VSVRWPGFGLARVQASPGGQDGQDGELERAIAREAIRRAGVADHPLAQGRMIMSRGSKRDANAAARERRGPCLEIFSSRCIASD